MCVVITKQLDAPSDSNSEVFFSKCRLNRRVSLNEAWCMINKSGGAIDSTCLLVGFRDHKGFWLRQ